MANLTTGALTGFNLICANTINATVVRTGPCGVYNITISNNSTTPAYLTLFDQTTVPAPATDVPVWRVMVPSTATGGQSIQIFDGLGLAFKRGLAFAVTLGIADVDTTPVAAATYIVGLSTCGGGN